MAGESKSWLKMYSLQNIHFLVKKMFPLFVWILWRCRTLETFPGNLNFPFSFLSFLNWGIIEYNIISYIISGVQHDPIYVYMWNVTTISQYPSTYCYKFLFMWWELLRLLLQQHNMVWLTLIIMLLIGFPEFIHVMNETLYPLTHISPVPGNHHPILCF